MSGSLSVLTGAVSQLYPELILLAAVCLMFLVAPFMVSARGVPSPGLRHRWGWLATLSLLGALAVAWTSEPSAGPFVGPFRFDQLTWFVRIVSLLLGLILVLVNWNAVSDAHAAESQACLLAIVAGTNLTAASNDLVMTFLALELVSIPTYVLLLVSRRDVAAQESTIKYFLLSLVSSAFLLFGLSWMYGVSGTTNLTAIGSALDAVGSGVVPKLVPVALVMIIAGLAFRLTAVPFHFYAPDVFQGAPLPASAMLSVIPKLVGFVALIRLVQPFLEAGSLGAVIQPVLWWLAVITMFVGNLLALLQTDIRRLLAYSSVSHAGYMLVGFLAGRSETAMVAGIDALLFYLVIYGAMTLGTFAVLSALQVGGRRISSIDDLAGLSRVQPGSAVLLAIFLFSLTGLPPTAGFLGKLNLFMSAWSMRTISGQWLSIWMALNAAIGAWYYLRLIGVMYLREPTTVEEGSPNSPPSVVAMLACAVATIGLFVAPSYLWELVRQAG